MKLVPEVSRISQIVDLDRHRPTRKDAEAPPACVAGQIHGDIDFQFVETLCDLPIAPIADIEEMFEGILHSPVHETWH
jgi:hypothetical protein